LARQEGATKISGGQEMTNYREILRLAEMGFNYTKIAEATGITRQTAATVLRRANELGIRYGGILELSDRELAQKLNPKDTAARLTYKLPDYEEVHKELQKPGVTIMLLWQEYCEKCRQHGELPYQETQFRKYYHDFAAQTKATMHLSRKPGELMEVDWAGTTAKITDNITGTPIANALGMTASRNFMTAKYVRLPELLADLAIARSEGTYKKVLKTYKSVSLLIIDEWLLIPLNDSESRDLLELAEGRYRKASTIFCSQFAVEGWHEKIGDPTLADAIVDRIVHDAYTIVIIGKESMRRKNGINTEN
jgi:hypothetical protein